MDIFRSQDGFNTNYSLQDEFDSPYEQTKRSYLPLSIISDLYKKYDRQNTFYHYSLRYNLKDFIQPVKNISYVYDRAVSDNRGSVKAVFYRFLRQCNELLLSSDMISDDNHFYEGNIKSTFFLIYGPVDLHEKVIKIIKLNSKNINKMVVMLNTFVQSNDCAICLTFVGLKALMVTWGMKNGKEGEVLKIDEEIEKLYAEKADEHLDCSRGENAKSLSQTTEIQTKKSENQTTRSQTTKLKIETKELSENKTKKSSQIETKESSESKTMKKSTIKDLFNHSDERKNLNKFLEIQHNLSQENVQTSYKNKTNTNNLSDILSNLNLKSAFLELPKPQNSTCLEIKQRNTDIKVYVFEQITLFRKFVKVAGVNLMEKSGHLVFVLVSFFPRRFPFEMIDDLILYVEKVYKCLSKHKGMILTQNPEFSYYLLPNSNSTKDFINEILSIFNETKMPKIDLQIIVHKHDESYDRVAAKLPNRAKNTMAKVADQVGKGIFACGKSRLGGGTEVAHIAGSRFFNVTHAFRNKIVKFNGSNR